LFFIIQYFFSSDINAFLSTHTVKQAVHNINTIKAELLRHLPGGMTNIRAIYIKSTNAPAVPIYVDSRADINEIKVKNNVTPRKIKKAKQYKAKRLEKKAKLEAVAAKKVKPSLVKRKAEKPISEMKIEKKKPAAVAGKEAKPKTVKRLKVKKVQ
jgi:hypothetical protein